MRNKVTKKMDNKLATWFLQGFIGTVVKVVHITVLGSLLNRCRLPQIDLNTMMEFLQPSTLWHRDEGLGSKAQERVVLSD